MWPHFFHQNLFTKILRLLYFLKIPVFSLFQNVPFKLSVGSHQVSNLFPLCSPRVFLIAPGFNPICFAQSPPLLTHIVGPRGRHFIFPLKLLFWVSLYRFKRFFVMGQSNWLIAKKNPVKTFVFTKNSSIS
jgi:hypothetical protein